MAAASSSTTFFGIREDEQNLMKQQSSTPTSSTAPITVPQKKRRNLPGTPSKFICEVCNKGFQREQNLQLHRRGHNLPWKLKQKTTKEVKRKVYLCPEPTCVHHDPSRALGDLTGIKKHFCRKHGEKKWKCDKCSKRYAVQSDWKAHSKTCGTREYRCDCGTLFSRCDQYWAVAGSSFDEKVRVRRTRDQDALSVRSNLKKKRDSFITHRAFCDALAQESARLPTGINTIGSHLYGSSNMGLGLPHVGSQISQLQDQNHPSSDMLRLGGAGGQQFDDLIPPPNPSSFRPPQPTHSSPFFLPGSNQDFHEEAQSHHGLLQNKPFHGLMQLPNLQNNTNNSSSSAAANLFNLSFFSNSSTSSSINNSNNANGNNSHLSSSGLLIHDQFHNGNAGSEGTTLFSGNIMGDHMGSSVSSFYNTSLQNDNVMSPMSATALLQKAAQMGSTTSGNSTSLLRGFGSSSSSGAKSERHQMTANYRGSFGGGGRESIGSQMENENQFQDLMNSLANGSSSIFGGGSAGVSTFGGNCNTGGHEQETSFGGFNVNRDSLGQHHRNTNLCKIDESKLHQNLTVSIGGSDGLTRDFLGVGGMPRGIGGGISQREQQHSIDISSLDSEIKSPAVNRSFGGGNLQ
ncbi:hypothetical protein HHK36_014676 [Tetracentron sinense]|uniref:C2H2-type domain-containing protein n=1 Tax=Tetracentron sinense TaxID=13715 RepID=A0A834Z4V0_TETSI|nr:hypothetical protein HHK36_014676 [Tetracentron sinense]